MNVRLKTIEKYVAAANMLRKYQGTKASFVHENRLPAGWFTAMQQLGYITQVDRETYTVNYKVFEPYDARKLAEKIAKNVAKYAEHKDDTCQITSTPIQSSDKFDFQSVIEQLIANNWHSVLVTENEAIKQIIEF